MRTNNTRDNKVFDSNSIRKSNFFDGINISVKIQIALVIFVIAITGAGAWVYTDPNSPIVNYTKGFQIGNSSMNATDVVTDNVTAKKIGEVIYADQYATLQDAVNATDSSHSTVYAPPGTYTLNENFTIGGTINVSLYIPQNVTLQGAGPATILKQAAGRNSHDLVLLSGKNSVIKDMTIDFNGDAQTYSVGANTFYSAIAVGETSNQADEAIIENIKFINTTSKSVDSDLTINAITLFYAPHAKVSNIKCTTFDECIFVTRAFDATITDYSVSNVWAENGTGYGVYYEAGDAIVQNIFTNGSFPWEMIGFGNATIQNTVSRNTKGGIRLGTDGAASGQFENIDIDGYGITVATTTQPFTIQNPVVRNAVGDGIRIASGYVNIINPQITNTTNSGINFEGSQGKVIGGNITKTRYNGITINLGSTADVFGTTISNTSLEGSNQFSGIVIAGDSFNSTIRNTRIQTNSLMRYSIEMTGGNNNTAENNWLSQGINGAIVLFGAESTSSQNRYAPGYNFGNKAVAPTQFGNGDSYFNTTSIQPCFYRAAWMNATGDEVVC